MKAKTVEELLVQLNLSQEEKVRHAELTEECLDREKTILACQNQSEERLEILGSHIDIIGSTLEAVHRSLQEINERLAETLLKRIPESKLPRA